MEQWLRYRLVLGVLGYILVLAVLHACQLFPRPGLYDPCHLKGAPVIILDGTVLNFPFTTRFDQTRFLFEGHAEPLAGFHGRTGVTLRFPAPDLMPGEHIRIHGWLSHPSPPTAEKTFDEQSYWRSQNTYSLLTVWQPSGLERLEKPGRFSMNFWAWRFHQAFISFWFRVLPEEEAALMCSMAIGAKGVLPSYIKDQCIRSGVYHILVVSGQKVALIIAFGVAVLRLIQVPQRWAFWICSPLIIFFALAVGSDPPVIRASIMAIIVLGVIGFGRDIPRMYPLFLAMLLLLVEEPAALFGASFQLSFGATASLMYFYPFLQRLNPFTFWLPRWLFEVGALCVAVHLGVWPLLIYYFHQVSLFGLLANWSLFPLSGVVTIVGLIVGTMGILFPVVPASLVWVAHVSLQGILKGLSWMDGCHWAAFPCSLPPWPILVLYYALLSCMALRLNAIPPSWPTRFPSIRK